VADAGLGRGQHRVGAEGLADRDRLGRVADDGDVAWQLTWVMSAGVRPAPAIAVSMARI